jgi:hypothetical protein
MAEIVLRFDGTFAYRLRGICGFVLDLSVHLLHVARDLLSLALDLTLHVPGEPSRSFFQLAASIFRSADYSIFVHWGSSGDDDVQRSEFDRVPSSSSLPPERSQ